MVGLRVEQPTNGQPATILFFRGDKIEPEIQAKLAEMRELLGLTPGQSAFRLVQSPLRGSAGDLAVASRSLMQMMAALSQGVEIPPKHRERRLTPPIGSVHRSSSVRRGAVIFTPVAVSRRESLATDSRIAGVLLPDVV